MGRRAARRLLHSAMQAVVGVTLQRVPASVLDRLDGLQIDGLNRKKVVVDRILDQIKQILTKKKHRTPQ